MNDQKKTKAQLIDEVTALRHRVAELEQAEAGRKHVEEALRESEENYRILFEHLPIPVFTKNLKGEYTSCNVENRKYWTIDPIGRTDAELFDHETAGALREADLQVMETEDTLTMEERLINTPLGERRVFSRKVPLHDTSGNIVGILGASIDITERKQAQQETQRLADVVNHMPVGLHVYHLEDIDDDRTLRLVAANPAAAKFTGVAMEDILERTIDENFPDSRPLGVPKLYADVVRTGQQLDLGEVEYGDARVNRGTYSVTAFPLPQNHVGITFENVTARNQMEQALRESEEKYRSLYASMTEGVALHEIVINKQGQAIDYVILDVNPAYELITRITKEQAVGRKASEIYQTGEPPYLEIYASVAASGEPTSFETYFSPMQKYFNISVFSPGQGKFATVFEDITERRQAEAQLKTSLREKEVMLQEIHHRVKNNLQVISSLLDMQADTIADDTVLQALQDSQQRIRSMALVHEKLYQSKDLARIDFAEYIEDMVDYLLMLYSDRIAYVTPRLEMAQSFLTIDAAIPCGLIINELVSNAMKHAFTEESTGRESSEICIVFEIKDGECQLVVSDNGTGLPPELTIDNSPSLGLQLVKILTGQLQGTIAVEREAGTSFTITFPETRSSQRKKS